MSDYLPNLRMTNGEDEQELDNGASWLQSIGSARSGPFIDPLMSGVSRSDHASPLPNPMAGTAFWQRQPNHAYEPSPADPPTAPYLHELQTDRPIYPYTPEELENWNNTSRPQKLTLEAVFQRNVSPDASSRAQLADELGMSTRQVQVRLFLLSLAFLSPFFV
ncbi:hypothetical protein FPV67DRAFT_517102 [Lyophyllum atratum]|nr:hypothetical protein FPV67DRAFT_517102 [Lyophyllum atratum]